MREIRTYGLNGGLRKRSRRATAPEVYQCPPLEPRRRWYQFSLRTLLIVVTICSALFAWLGFEVHKAQEQRTAVAAIRQIGGDVFYADDYLPSPFGNQAPPPPARAPAWLRSWLGDDFLRRATRVSHRPGSKKWKATDTDLAWLEKLPHLESLDLSYTQITDAGLVHLRSLTKLRYLSLSGTNITDAGLVNLRGLARLEYFFHYGTYVTADGRIEIETALPNLRRTEIETALPNLKRNR